MSNQPQDKQQTGVDEVENILVEFAKDLIEYDQQMIKARAPNIRFIHKYLKRHKAAIQHLLDEREREAYKRGYIAAGVDGLTAELGEVGK